MKRWMVILGYSFLTIILLVYWVPRLFEPHNVNWTMAGVLGFVLCLVAIGVKKIFGKSHPWLASFLLTVLSLPIIAIIWNAPTFDPETGYRSTFGREVSHAVLSFLILGCIGFLWYAWNQLLSEKN